MRVPSLDADTPDDVVVPSDCPILGMPDDADTPDTALACRLTDLARYPALVEVADLI